MRLAWQVLFLLGRWQCWELHRDLGRAQLLWPVILCGFDAARAAGQSACSSLQYPSHKYNFIFLYEMIFLCVCVCIYCMYEYAGISMCVYECVYRAHVCIHTYRCIHVSIYVFIDPNVSISMYTHMQSPSALGCSSLQQHWLGCGTGRPLAQHTCCASVTEATYNYITN